MKKDRRRNQVRFSTPPYWVARRAPGHPVAFNVPGVVWNCLARSLEPSDEETRGLLIALRRDFRWPRTTLAALLGACESTVYKWEEGRRSMSGPAKRLIFWLDALARGADLSNGGVDLIFWGRGRELSGDNSQVSVATAASAPAACGIG